MPDARNPPQRRAAYHHFRAIPTRWMDNDLYGHVNNVVYYSYFDTIINSYLIEAGGLDIHRAEVIGIAVETMCRFRTSLAFPRRSMRACVSGISAAVRCATKSACSNRVATKLRRKGILCTCSCGATRRNRPPYHCM